MIERTARRGGRHVRFNTVQQRMAMRLDPGHGTSLPGQFDQPVDVDGSRHVGLNLRIQPGARQRHGIAGTGRVQGNRIGAVGHSHVHSSRADDRATDRAGGIVQPASDRGAHHIDISEHDRQPARQPGVGRGGSGQGMMRPCAIDNVGKKMRMAGYAEPFADSRRITHGAKIAVGKDGFRRIDRRLTGQLEIEPILAMQRTGGSDQPFRLMLLQPRELDRLLAGVEAGPGCRIVSCVVGTGYESRGHLGGAKSSQIRASPIGSPSASTSQQPSP